MKFTMIQYEMICKGLELLQKDQHRLRSEAREKGDKDAADNHYKEAERAKTLIADIRAEKR